MFRKVNNYFTMHQLHVFNINIHIVLYLYLKMNKIYIYIYIGWKDPLEKKMATDSNISCLEISMDRGAWQAIVHGLAKNQTQLSIHTPCRAIHIL